MSYHIPTVRPSDRSRPAFVASSKPRTPFRASSRHNSLVRSVSSSVFGILGQAAGATGDDHVVMSRRNLPDERASVRTNPGMNPRDFSSTP